MERTWEEELRLRVVVFLFRNGFMVRAEMPALNYGGWIDYGAERAGDVRGHVAACGLDLSPGGCSWSDTEWEEFDGTFAEPPWGRHTGIEARVVCRCGQVDRVWRHEGTYAELLAGVADLPAAALDDLTS